MSVASSRCSSTDSRSPPALTRESTNSNAVSVLPTPMDHPLHQGSNEPKGLAPSVDNVQIRTPPSCVGSIVSDEQSGDPEVRPVDSYFPPTRSPAAPVRNRSAKELISRYEAMTPSLPGTSAKASVASPLESQRDSDSPRPDTVSNHPLSALKGRSRSPLRNSFRNLMSIFAKKGKSRDDESSFISSRYESALSSPANTHVPSPQVQRRSPTTMIDQSPLRSGPVLYLARPNSDSTLPVWTNCRASLFEDRILLEWLTAYGNPLSSTIMLQKSTDVHSLAKSQVDPMEKTLLPLTGQDAYIFELTYPGGLPERFATSSVTERSAWVSCIWDALLKLEKALDVEEPIAATGSQRLTNEKILGTPSQTSTLSEPPIPPRLSDEITSAPMCHDNNSGTSDATTSTAAAQSRLEDIRTRTGRISAQSAVASSGVAAESTSTAPSSPTRTTHRTSQTELLSTKCSSPSIQNLGNLSIVQTRLSTLTAKDANHNVSRAPTQLSRQSSEASNYSNASSRAPSHLATPQSIRKDASRTKSRTTNAPLSRTASIDSKYEDEQSIYDFYAQPSFTGRRLSPVLDVSETETLDTPRALPATPSNDLISKQLPRLTSKWINKPTVTRVQAFSTLRDDRPLPDIPKNQSRQVSRKTISSYATVSSAEERGDTSNVHPLLALIEDHAARQYNQTSGIGDQIASLQQEVLAMSNELRAVIAEQEPGTALRGVLEDLCAKMERTVITNGVGLHELHHKIDSIAIQLSAQNRMAANCDPRPPPVINESFSQYAGTLEKISISIDEARDIVKSDIPFIKEKLSSLQELAPALGTSHINARLDELLELYRSLQSPQVNLEASVPTTQELQNVAPVEDVKDPDALKMEGCTNKPDSNVDVAVEEKGVAEEKTPEKLQENKPEEIKLPTAADIEPKLLEILSLLKNEQDSKKLAAEQQAENARYLQELNTWLESFVSNGTTQIQSVARGVEKLCRELAPPHADVGNSEDPGPKGLRAELSALAADVKAGENRDAIMQALATEALQAIKSKESDNKPLDVDAIIQMIEHQKQEQEAMLRGIATELSNDIRGERLRFVEAMKEATAINVQAHVEEFKKELGKEVMMMTCEVGRLQRERQMLEQQIADLFSFFAKQRAELESNQAEMARQAFQAPQAPQAQTTPKRSNSKRRPLPVPK